jgi:major type 1 subunit fimbrin (pilin)
VRKSTQTLFAAAALTLLVMNSATQAASTGTITFNGELTQNTCDVNVGGQGPDAVVVLPTVTTSVLQTPGQTTGRKDFSMVLSNCVGTLRTVAAFFQAGSTVDTVTGRLKNTNGSGATNVSLQLLDIINGYKAIQAGNQNQIANTSYVVATTGSANLLYSVQYYAEGATTPGLVTSSVVYSLMYK